MTDYPKQLSLAGKVALVTGAARGLGAEMAEALLQAIAEEAYICGLPIIMNYGIMYAQAVDSASP